MIVWKRLCLAGLFITICSGESVADAFDEYRTACTAKQNSVVTTAIAQARSLLAAADRSLPPANTDIGIKFKRWFGGPEGDDDPKLKKAYAEVGGFLQMKNFWCVNKTIPGSIPGALAFVPKGSFIEIFLESGFFALPDSGADSKGGTIVHELSHQSTINPTIDSDVTGDGKPDYGIRNAEQLARSRPKDARRTGDNFEYFAEDVFFGIP